MRNSFPSSFDLKLDTSKKKIQSGYQGLLFVVVVFLASCSDSNRIDPSLIKGKWLGDSTIFRYEDLAYKARALDVKMVFRPDSVYWGFQGGKGHYTFAYSVSSDQLILNEEIIKIIKLTENELVIRRTSSSHLYDFEYYHKGEGMDW